MHTNTRWTLSRYSFFTRSFTLFIPEIYDQSTSTHAFILLVFTQPNIYHSLFALWTCQFSVHSIQLNWIYFASLFILPSTSSSWISKSKHTHKNAAIFTSLYFTPNWIFHWFFFSLYLELESNFAFVIVRKKTNGKSKKKNRDRKNMEEENERNLSAPCDRIMCCCLCELLSHHRWHILLIVCVKAEQLTVILDTICIDFVVWIRIDERACVRWWLFEKF